MGTVGFVFFKINSEPEEQTQEFQEEFPSLRVGIVSDIHKCSNREFDPINAELLANFIGELDREKTDLNVNLGDTIDYRVKKCSESAKEDLVFVLDAFRKAKTPFFAVLSDHDIDDRGSLNDWLEKYKLEKTYQTFTVKDYQIIFLDTTLGGAEKGTEDFTWEEKSDWDQGKLSSRQVDWLKEILANNQNKKVIIFSGHPLFSFEKINPENGKSKKYGIKNTKEVLKILAESNREIIAVTGDAHQWLEKKIGKLQFYVIGSFKYSGEEENWAVLEVGGDNYKLEKRKLKE